MPGTREGGLKAAATNKMLYGKKFYEDIGREGGKVSRGGGFSREARYPDGTTGVDRARIAGQQGGRVSSRAKEPK